MDLAIRLRDDLYNIRRNYRNGRKEKTLLDKKEAYYSIRDYFQPDSEFFDNIIVRIHQQLDRIPRPRGFLEQMAYSLGNSLPQ